MNGNKMKNKTTDYILGMITAFAISIAIYSCTNPVYADNSNDWNALGANKFNPMYVKVVE